MKKSSIDEVVSPISVKYSDNAYFGFKNQAQIFDINRMDICKSILIKRTVVSAIGVNKEKEIFGLGCYNKNLYLYDTRTKYFCSIEHNAGITQVVFDNELAIVGCRNDTQVYLWDLRNTDYCLGTFYRNSQTSQRMYFGYSPETKILLSGSLDGSVLKYNIKDLSFIGQFPCMFDCTSSTLIIDQFESHISEGDSLENKNYKHLCIAGSGQRHFNEYESSSSDEEADNTQKEMNEFLNGIRIFSI